MENILTRKKTIEEKIRDEYGDHGNITKHFEKKSEKNSSKLGLSSENMANIAPHNSGWNVERDKIDITIIGAGGTGGYLIRDLCRFVYSLNERLIHKEPRISINIVDADIVEDKNILRQNFLPRDVNTSKAEVLAARHARAFGVDITYLEEMLEVHGPKRLNSLSKFIGEARTKKIIVGCVDNNEARRQVVHLIERLQKDYSYSKDDFYWIDSGNERKSGQVIVGSKDLMDVTDLYPEILLKEYDSKEEISCADRMLQDEQNMFVNLTAANLILNYIKSIMLDVTMVSNGTVFNIDNVFDSYYIMKKD